MDIFIILLLAIISIPPIMLFIFNTFIKPKLHNSREQLNNTHVEVYETNAITANHDSSCPTNNILYPEQADPVPEYSPPDEPSHVAISIPHNEPSSASVQMPTTSQEAIDRPPAYGV